MPPPNSGLRRRSRRSNGGYSDTLLASLAVVRRGLQGPDQRVGPSLTVAQAIPDSRRGSQPRPRPRRRALRYSPYTAHPPGGARRARDDRSDTTRLFPWPACYHGHGCPVPRHSPHGPERPPGPPPSDVTEAAFATRFKVLMPRGPVGVLAHESMAGRGPDRVPSPGSSGPSRARASRRSPAAKRSTPSPHHPSPPLGSGHHMTLLRGLLSRDWLDLEVRPWPV
jgi:hypothetical protein